MNMRRWTLAAVLAVGVTLGATAVTGTVAANQGGTCPQSPHYYPGADQSGDWGSIVSLGNGIQYSIADGYTVEICAKASNGNNQIVVEGAASGTLYTPVNKHGEPRDLSHWAYAVISVPPDESTTTTSTTTTTEPAQSTTTTTMPESHPDCPTGLVGLEPGELTPVPGDVWIATGKHHFHGHRDAGYAIPTEWTFPAGTFPVTHGDLCPDPTTTTTTEPDESTTTTTEPDESTTTTTEPDESTTTTTEPDESTTTTTEPDESTTTTEPDESTTTEPDEASSAATTTDPEVAVAPPVPDAAISPSAGSPEAPVSELPATGAATNVALALGLLALAGGVGLVRLAARPR